MKDFIHNNLLDKNGKLNVALNKKHKIDLSPEELYNIYYDNLESNKCKVCGKITKFISFNKGYAESCSRECTKILNPRKNSYKRDKIYQEFFDNFNQYTTKNDDKLNEYLTKILNRTSKPSLDIYDLLKYPNEIKFIVQKSGITLTKNYKDTNFKEILYRFTNNIVETPKCVCSKNLKFLNGKKGYSDYCSRDCSQKHNNTRIQNNINKLISIIDKTKFNIIKLYPLNKKPSLLECNVCKTKFTKWFRNGKMNNTILCPCCDKSKSLPEIELSKIILNPIENSRSIIKPYELDLYSKEFKFAIEYNGLMYHSYGESKYAMFNNSNEDPNYHLRKTELAEQKGITLFHIFENEYLNSTKKNIWLSLIKDKQNLLIEVPNSSIMSLVNVDPYIAKEFFNNNSLERIEYVERNDSMYESFFGFYLPNDTSVLAFLVYFKEYKNSNKVQMSFTNNIEYNISKESKQKYIKSSIDRIKSVKKNKKSFYIVCKQCRRYNNTLNNILLDIGFTYSYSSPRKLYFNLKNKKILMESPNSFNNEKDLRIIYDCGKINLYLRIDMV